MSLRFFPVLQYIFSLFIFCLFYTWLHCVLELHGETEVGHLTLHYADDFHWIACTCLSYLPSSVSRVFKSSLSGCLFLREKTIKFLQKRRLYTWTSPDGQYRNQIDYILCSQRWRSSIQSAKTRPGADYGSNHELLLAKFRLKLKKLKEESEKVGLKFSIQKAEIMASGLITSWQIDGETMKQWETLFWGLQNQYRWWLQPWN